VNDLEGTRRNIVEVATLEFACKADGGARRRQPHANQQAHDPELLRLVMTARP
jgi:hypothetical protein